MVELRPYQIEAIAGIRAAFAQKHRAVLFVLPTGGGKSYAFCAITQGAVSKGNRVCILVHRAELLRQASASLTSLGVRHGLIAANRSMDLTMPVQVASVQTLARRLHKLPPELFQLLVVDEAHHSNAGTWAQVLNHFHAAKVLGVTATPCRCDGRGLGEWYSAMVLGPTPQELTDAGYLAPARVLAPPGMSLQGLRKRMGDYDMRQAGEMLQAGQAMGDALSHYRQHLNGQTAIAFCCSVAHAEAVAELFNRHGIAAASIDGSMDALQRERLLADLGAGRLKVLTSCSLIGEGVDVPSVGGCILLRPTQSVSLHLQMIGRCLRPQPGKVAVVLDHVGNCLRLGHHLDEREWTLEGLRKREGPKAPSVRVCPSCFCAMPSGKPECIECGHVFAPERRELEHVDGELVEMFPFEVGDFVKIKHEVSDYKYKYRSKKEFYPIVEIYNGRARLKVNTSIGFWADLADITYGAVNEFKPGDIIASKDGYIPPNHLLSVLSVNKNMVEIASCNAKGKGRVGTAPAENFVLVTRPDLAKERKREQAQAQTMKELAAIGKSRGMKSPYAWAHHVMTAREAKRIAAE